MLNREGNITLEGIHGSCKKDKTKKNIFSQPENGTVFSSKVQHTKKQTLT